MQKLFLTFAHVVKYIKYLKTEKANNKTLNSGNYLSFIKESNPILYSNLFKKYYPYFLHAKGSELEFSQTEVTCFQYNIYCHFTQRHESVEQKKQYIQVTASNWGLIGNYPVVKVDWYDAIQYANWLSEKNGYAPYYKIDRELLKGISSFTRQDTITYNLDKNSWLVSFNQEADGYRLPTLKEWQMAAQGENNSYDYDTI